MLSKQQYLVEVAFHSVGASHLLAKKKGCPRPLPILEYYTSTSYHERSTDMNYAPNVQVNTVAYLAP